MNIYWTLKNLLRSSAQSNCVILYINFVEVSEKSGEEFEYWGEIFHFYNVWCKRRELNVSLAACMGVSDVVFLLDGSCSVGRQNFDKAKNFVVDVISNFYIHQTGELCSMRRSQSSLTIYRWANHRWTQKVQFGKREEFRDQVIRNFYIFKDRKANYWWTQVGWGDRASKSETLC